MIDSDCIFCQIVAGSLPSYIVFEDSDIIAFLDNEPLFPGHVLVCPRDHHETLAELAPNLLTPLFSKVQLLCRAVEAALDAEGTFVAINNRVSQAVPHLHVHVVPRRRRDGLKGFFWPRHGYVDASAREAVRDAIERQLQKMLE